MSDQVAVRGMTTMQAGQVFALVLAQWPTLGGEEPMDRLRIKLWMNTIGVEAFAVAMPATERMITTWESQWPPLPAQWRHAVIAEHERIAPRPLPDLNIAPEERATGDDVAALVRRLKGALQDAGARKKTGERAVLPGRPIPAHEEGEMLTYDEVYGGEPEQPAEEEQRGDD